MTMIAGITATRTGCTTFQLARLTSLVIALKPKQWHHGGCDGGDRQSHELIKTTYPFPQCRIILHPPKEEDELYQLAWYKDTPGLIVLPGAPHLKRNGNIVDSIGVLFALPHTRVQQPRGGTWYTVNYARKKNRPLVLIYPDGTYEKEMMDKWPHAHLLM